MKHNIMHVEVYLGPEEQSLGARWHSGVVQVFNTYKFESKSYRITDIVFKTIDPWLDGICKSYCVYHSWDEQTVPLGYSMKSNSMSRLKMSINDNYVKKYDDLNNNSIQGNLFVDLPSERKIIDRYL